MSRYVGWSKEDLIWKIYELEGEIDRLKKENSDQRMEISSLSFRIEQELEPRIRAERRAYDRFITTFAGD